MVYLLSAQQIGWNTISANKVIIHTGLELDMYHVAPKTMAQLAADAAACADWFIDVLR